MHKPATTGETAPLLGRDQTLAPSPSTLPATVQMPLQQRVLRLKHTLAAAVRDSNAAAVKDTLARLDALPLTLAVMQNTEIGVDVYRLRPMPQAQALVDKWRSQFAPPGAVLCILVYLSGKRYSNYHACSESRRRRACYAGRCRARRGHPQHRRGRRRR